MDIGHRLLIRIGIVAAAAAAGLCLVPGGAAPVAAVSAIATVPSDTATLLSPPPQVSVTFDAPIGTTFDMSISCNGTPPPYTAARLAEDTRTLIIDAAATPLPKGQCNVAWRVQDLSDGGTDRGAFSFTIQQDAVATVAGAVDPNATATTTTADAATSSSGGSNLRGPLGLFRWMSTIAIAALFGGLVLITVAWPEGVEYILTIRFLRYAWILAAVTTWITIACVVAQIRGEGFTSGLVPTSWGSLTDDTPGIALIARMVLVVACGWVAIRPERVIDPTTQLAALAGPALAVVTLGFSRSGGDLEIVGYAAGVVHALAMAVWFGGLVLLSRVVLAGPGEDDLVHAVRGFGRLATPAMLLTVVSGAAQLYRLDRGHLFDSTHGRILMLKVIPVVAMVFVGVATRQFVRARLNRAETLSAPIAGKLRRAVGMEALIGVAVLGLTSWMLSTQPANLARAATLAEFAYELRLTDATEKLDATIYVTPARVGTNAVLVVIDKPLTGISNFVLRFDPPADAPVSPVVITVIQFPPGVTGWYLPMEAGMPLSADGVWQVTLDLVSADGTFKEAGGMEVVDTNKRTDDIPVVTQPPITAPTTTIALAPTTVAG